VFKGGVGKGMGGSRGAKAALLKGGRAAGIGNQSRTCFCVAGTSGRKKNCQGGKRVREAPKGGDRGTFKSADTKRRDQHSKGDPTKWGGENKKENHIHIQNEEENYQHDTNTTGKKKRRESAEPSRKMAIIGPQGGWREIPKTEKGGETVSKLSVFRRTERTQCLD